MDLSPFVATALIVGDEQIVQKPKVPGPVAKGVALVDVEIPLIWLVNYMEVERGFFFWVVCAEIWFAGIGFFPEPVDGDFS